MAVKLIFLLEQIISIVTFPLFFTFNQLRFHATSFSLPLANQSFKYCMGDW